MSVTPNNRNINIMSFPLLEDNSGYVADEPLIQAVEIALALGKPLIVSGEPGTGKTKLADWVAGQLYEQTKDQPYAFLPNALVFNTKSVSSAHDLFYYYDAISHFQNQEKKSAAQFIELCAMGTAIAQSYGKNSEGLSGLTELKDYKSLHDQPRSSVILVDEIDKAPRDFPNDLLNEMEKYQFRIKELNQEVSMNRDAKMLVILTSNSEKNLPNAFLRRCVFYHIPFPDKAKLIKIAKARLGGETDTTFSAACDQFMEFRRTALNKKPATSEFLDWMRVLKKFNLFQAPAFGQEGTPEEKVQFRSSLNTLFKSREDLEKLPPSDTINS